MDNTVTIGYSKKRLFGCPFQVCFVLCLIYKIIFRVFCILLGFFFLLLLKPPGLYASCCFLFTPLFPSAVFNTVNPSKRPAFHFSDLVFSTIGMHSCLQIFLLHFFYFFFFIPWSQYSVEQTKKDIQEYSKMITKGQKR